MSWESYGVVKSSSTRSRSAANSAIPRPGSHFFGGNATAHSLRIGSPEPRIGGDPVLCWKAKRGPYHGDRRAGNRGRKTIGLRSSSSRRENEESPVGCLKNRASTRWPVTGHINDQKARMAKEPRDAAAQLGTIVRNDLSDFSSQRGLTLAISLEE